MLICAPRPHAPARPPTLQAVERVRITVQLRRLAHTKRGGSSGGLYPGGGGDKAQGMSREAMRAALDRLHMHTASAAGAQ